MNVNWIPSVPAFQDADTLLISFETAFIQSMRSTGAATWPEQFGYVPGMNFPYLDVRFPVDFTTYGFKAWSGEHEFREEVSDYIDMTIAKFQEGARLDVEKLRDPRSAEVILWNQREAAIADAWANFLAPELYTTLSAGDATGTWRLTGGSNFFATNHYVNKHSTGLGTFSNLLNNGGSKASTPIYAVLGGGAFSQLRPWAILRGEGMGPAIARVGGGGTAAPGAGEPWIVRWGTDSEYFKNTGKVKVSVVGEKGWSLFWPHSIIRQEGDLTYANLKELADTARSMKDLNGRVRASQTTIQAILCEPGDVSAVNALLGREVIANNATAPTGAISTIDSMLRSVPVIPLDR